MNKLMLSCIVAGLVLTAQAKTWYDYWVEGDLRIALTVTYTDESSAIETDTSYSVKSKTVKITNATIIKTIAANEGLTGIISSAAKLMMIDGYVFIRDPKGLGEDYDVSGYFGLSWGDFSSYAERTKWDAYENLKSSSGSGQILTDMVLNLAAPITLRGLDKYTWKASIPKDDINEEVYYTDSDSITCIGGDEATFGVVSGTVTIKEKLVKAKVVIW